MNVLVTDASYKHALGIVRSLGRKGMRVTSLGGTSRDLAFASRYCHNSVVALNPNEPGFGDAVLSLVRQEHIDVVIPVGYGATIALAKQKADFASSCSLEVASYDQIELAGNKKHVASKAREVGIPTPLTLYPASLQEALDERPINFPVVIKAVKESPGHTIQLVSESDRFATAYKQFAASHSDDSLPMVQEYIPGHGCGFFAIYQDGVCKRIFMHRRIRENPPGGGASSCAESFYDLKLKQYGIRLLDHLKWHGVAMVEFRYDERDQDYKLLEVNPKFWGSLDLALAAGVDFPYFLCQIADGRELSYSETYQRGLRFHWPLSGDFQHCWQRPSSWRSVLRDCLDPRVRSNLGGVTWDRMSEKPPLHGAVCGERLPDDKSMPWRCLAHVHTRFSFDSWLSPREILTRARLEAAEVLMVTDHNTIRGSVEVAKLAQGNPKFVVIGGEYATEKGDVIGLFLTREIQSRNSREVIDEIKRQGGLVLLPHPYKAHVLDDALLEQVDMIEIHNSRCSSAENGQSAVLALRMRKPTLGGADAHCAGEVRSVVNHFEADTPGDEAQLRICLMHSPRSLEVRPVSQLYQPYSQMIKAYKTKNLRLFVHQLKRMAMLVMAGG